MREKRWDEMLETDDVSPLSINYQLFDSIWTTEF